MSHRGQSHLKTITRTRPVSLKPPIQHLLCLGALKGAWGTCTRRLFWRLFLLAPHSSRCNIEHGVHLLKTRLLHDERTVDAWIPTSDPTAPPRPLKSWLNDVNVIRKQTAALYNYYTDLKPGCGDVPPFSQKTVPIVEGKKILQKTGDINQNIATEDIEGWSDMMDAQLAKGPKKEKINFEIGWKSSLVVWYEISCPQENVINRSSLQEKVISWFHLS